MNPRLFLMMEDQGRQLSKFSELNVCQKYMIIDLGDPKVIDPVSLEF
jgi:hypothetical protein